MQVFATSPAAVYTGIGNAFTRISSTEGMRALWRGVSSVIMGAGPAHAVHFGTYEAVKEFAGGNVGGGRNQWMATCALILSSVSLCPKYPDNVACLALAGASATIASDALMNPFDGETVAYIFTYLGFLSRLYSDQAAHADTQIRIPFGGHMRANCVQERGTTRILHFVPYNADDDSTLHRRAVHRVRADQGVP